MHSILAHAQLLADSSEGSLGGSIFSLVIGVLLIASMWKVFTKAGEPGWAAIVPIYNAYVLLKIAGKPAWWLLLYFVPIVNFLITIVVAISIAQRFGKGAGFGIGLVFLPFIFCPLLGFGSSTYSASR